ncbi:MAG: hypothetical protein WBA57_12235 [Elainellaceae cyanobacterium]
MKKILDGFAIAGALGVGFFLLLNTLTDVIKEGSIAIQQRSGIDDREKSLAIFDCYTAQRSVAASERVTCDVRENWSQHLD